MSLALAIFHLHEHNTSGFEVSGMVHCVHWENATIFCWCSRTQAFQKYKVPATFEGFVASLKNFQHNFPKIHPFRRGSASLTLTCKSNLMKISGIRSQSAGTSPSLIVPPSHHWTAETNSWASAACLPKKWSPWRYFPTAEVGRVQHDTGLVLCAGCQQMNMRASTWLQRFSYWIEF